MPPRSHASPKRPVKTRTAQRPASVPAKRPASVPAKRPASVPAKRPASVPAMVVTTMQSGPVCDPTTTADFRLSGWHHGYGTVFVATHKGVMMAPEDYRAEEWVTSARAAITRDRVGHLGAGLKAMQVAWKDLDDVTALVCREAWWDGFEAGALRAHLELSRGHKLKPELVAPDLVRTRGRTLATVANGIKRFFTGG